MRNSLPPTPAPFDLEFGSAAEALKLAILTHDDENSADSWDDLQRARRDYVVAARPSE